MSNKIRFLLVFVLVAILAAPGLHPAFAQEDDHLHVEIDIKPGSDTNPINLKSGGLVPVALFGSAEFDVKTVDTATVVLGKMDHQSPGAPAVRFVFEDVNDDGIQDILFFFRAAETGLEPSDTMACLHGMTLDGVQFCGHDSVKIIG